MMICPDYRVAFVSMPRAGTHTMYHLLAERFGGERYGGFHHRRVPGRMRDWFVFSIVRNPYSRVCASWTWSHLSEHSESIIRDVGGPDLLGFVRGLNTTKRRWYPCMTQVDLLEGVRPDAVLHIENLNAEFNALPFVKEPVAVPHLNASDHEPWRELVTGEIAAEVRKWAACDFEAFGYDIEDVDG